MKILKKLGAVLCAASLIFISFDWNCVFADDSDIPAPQVVDASGEEVTQEQYEATMDLLNSIEDTTDYVVYADQISNGCNHIEGNIAVNQVVADTDPTYTNSEFMIKIDMMSNDEEKLSYIGQVDDGIKVTTENADDILVTQDENAGVDVNNKGTTLLIDSIDSQVVTEALTEVVSQEAAEDFAQEIQINENLTEIKEAAEAAASTLSEVNGEMSNEDAVSAVTDMLNANSLGKDDIIILNLTSEELQNLSSAQDNGGVPTLTARLRQLLDANQTSLATVILNVTTNNEPNITIAQGIRSSDQNQNGESNGYLIWNFGSYDGTITFNGIMSGVTVAPNATVISNDTYEGRIIAQVYKHNGSETHTPQKYDKEYPKEPPKEDEPPQEEPPKEDKPPQEEPPKDDESPRDEPPVVTPPDDLTPPGPEPSEPGPEPTPTPVPPAPQPTPITPDSIVVPERSETETVVYIPDTPVPLSSTFETREAVVEENPASQVLGAIRKKATTSKDVLGERRGPETGDNGLTLWVCLFIVSLFIIFAIPPLAEKRNRYNAAAAKVFY